MESQNSFSINLNQQQTVAKKRLKAIRQRDEGALNKIRKYHDQPDALSFENIQLADVQHALARELGLPSWSLLKAHVADLESKKHAISRQVQALDHDLKTLHVRCGHDIQQRLKESGFEGHFLPMTDPLCIGPIPSDEPSFFAVRARYVVSTLLPVMRHNSSVQDIVHQEQKNLTTLLSDEYERIIFWVEHDSYDQLMLLRCLTYLDNVSDKAIEIIELNHYPGTERFIGFGQLPAEAIRSCWQYRKPVSAKLISQARRCWDAVTSDKPDSIVALLQHHDLDCLPNIRAVLMRHLQELPHLKSGLSLTQRLALSVLKEQEQAISVAKWFQLYQQREPLPYLGDVMFYALMLPLTTTESPLLILGTSQKHWWEQQVTITQHGEQCLEHKVKFLQDHWVGGIRVNRQSSWVWDQSQLSTLACIQH